MPKAAFHPDLQAHVHDFVHARSACELGRVCALHRSTVLRFCASGRATAGTASRLRTGLEVLNSSSGKNLDSDFNSVLNTRSTALKSGQLQNPNDLQSLRTMLMSLISVIDNQLESFCRSEEISPDNRSQVAATYLER